MERPGLPGRWRDAIERLHATNNFPEFTGRLCPAPCEAACVLGINEDPVTIKQIELRDHRPGLGRGWVVPLPPDELDRQDGGRGRVRVRRVWPPPSSSTRAGHRVTVFERDDRIGGLLRYGIPEFKMEKRVLDRRLEQMRAEGTEFRAGVNVGVDITAEQLRADFDAVVLAGGATAAARSADSRPGAGRHPPGDGVPAVAVTACRKGTTSRRRRGPPITAKGKKVVIIGGGDTGADCLGTAHRQGAANVHQFEIMPRPPDARAESTPWPTYPLMYRISSAHEEGGERVFSVNTEQFVGKDGQVAALKVHEVTMRDGRFVKVEGSDFELDADLVLLAMGFVGPEKPGLLTDLGVKLTDRGNVARGADFDTSVPGVFVAGDMGRGQSLIVWAIAEGRAAAAGVDRYLMGSTALPAPIKPTAAPLV